MWNSACSPNASGATSFNGLSRHLGRDPSHLGCQPGREHRATASCLLGYHRDEEGRLDPVGRGCRLTWLQGPWAVSHREGMLGWMCLSHRVQDSGCL